MEEFYSIRLSIVLSTAGPEKGSWVLPQDEKMYFKRDED